MRTVENFMLELLTEVKQKCSTGKVSDNELAAYVVSQLNSEYDAEKWNSLITMASTYMSIVVSIAADRVYLYPLVFYRSTSGFMSISDDLHQLMNCLHEDQDDTAKIAAAAVGYAIDLGFAQTLTDLEAACGAASNCDVEACLNNLLLLRLPRHGISVWVSDETHQEDGTLSRAIECRIEFPGVCVRRYPITLVRDSVDKSYELSTYTVELRDRLIQCNSDKES